MLDARLPLILRALSWPLVGSLLYPLSIPRREEDALRGLSLMGHSPATRAAQPAALSSCYFHFPRLPHNRVATTSLLAMQGTHLGERDLARVSVPTLQVWGARDPFAPVATGERIARAIPEGRLHVFPQGGHLPWLDEPAETARQLRATFARGA